MKRILTHWLIPVLTLAVLCAWGLHDPFVKQIARLKSFDLIQRYDAPTLSKDVAIVEIDEKSIEQYGQWPWKRDVMADIIYRLREAGAGVIVLPILFSEPDRLGGDQALADAMKNNGVVIAQVGTTQANRNAVPRGVAKIGDPMPWLYEWPGMLGPVPTLGESAAGVGVINTAPEIDGVVRRIPLLMRVGNETYPAMAIETIRVAVGDPSYQVKTQQGGITAMRIPKYKTIKTDANAQIWLRWNKEFVTVSAADDFKSLTGKVVIVGITAEGLGGVIATPNGEAYSHSATAVALQTVINGDNIVRIDYATFLEYISAAIIAIILIVASAYAPYWLIGTLLLLTYAGSAYASYFAFTRQLQLWDVSWLWLVITITSFHAVFNRFVKEFTLKQQIKKQFEHYLAPSMVAQLQKNPELLKLGGETREMTFMFSDIRGFTPISEKYKNNPAGLTRLINRFLTRMTDIIIANGGTIDKFMGDCIMAFWNAPLDTPDHAKRAVDTAIKMQKELKLLNAELKKENLPAINIGIGINTGTALVGNMGSEQRFDYSVIGDDVNLASRLESSSKDLETTLVIGENTRKQCGKKVKFKSLGTIKVKGKTNNIKVYTL
jgi:adenylate cyclase